MPGLKPGFDMCTNNLDLELLCQREQEIKGWEKAETDIMKTLEIGPRWRRTQYKRVIQ